MLEIIRSTYFIFILALISCFYIIWFRGRKKETKDLYSDFDKLALLIFVFLIISRLFNLIAYYGAYQPTSIWSLSPITRYENLETGDISYLLFQNFPWIIFRFLDYGYFLFASILVPWVYSLIMSKFRFGKVFDTEFLLSIKISIVLMFGLLSYRLLNNNFNDINVINIAAIIIMLGVTFFLAFTKKESAKLTFRLSFILMLAMMALELNLIKTLDTNIVLAFALIWTIWGLLLLFKYTAELQITRKDRSKSDIDLVKERVQIIRRFGVRESKGYNLSYKSANKMDQSKVQLEDTLLERIRKIFKSSPTNGNSN
ncbi:MAG: hypothetical protein WCK31_00700 [bacterium]